MKKILSVALCVAMISAFAVTSVSANTNKTYFKDDYEAYDVGVSYGVNNPMETDLYAVWEEPSNVLTVAENSMDENYNNSFALKRSVLYSAWDLDKLFNTTEETVVLDMMLGAKAINSVTINGYFNAVGGDIRGEQRRLLWIADYNERFIMKVAEEGVDSFVDLKKKIMNRVTLAIKMNDQKNATVQLYINGEVASDPVSVGIRSKSLLRFAIDGWTGGSGNDIYLDNVNVTGITGSIEDFFETKFEGGATGSIATENNNSSEEPNAQQPTEDEEITKEFKPEKDPDGKINVYIDGQKVIFDVPPVIMNGRTMVPMRKIFEEIGATIDWDPDTQTVVGRKDDNMVKIVVGSEKASINGEIVVLDQSATIVDSRTLVPIRVASEGLGLNVEWDAETQSVLMSTK